MATGINTITFKEMIAEMDTGNHFSIGWRTHSTSTGEGGEWMFAADAIKSGFQEKSKNEKAAESNEKFRKNPNHYSNSTRNIVEMPSFAVTKINLRLVRKFNNKTVL